MFMGSLPPASNRADWSEIFEFYDDVTGEQIDLTGSTVTLELSDRDCRNVTASIIIVDTGKIEASIPASQMRQFCAGTYEVGCTLTRGGIITQEFIGSLPILDGVIR